MPDSPAATATPTAARTAVEADGAGAARGGEVVEVDGVVAVVVAHTHWDREWYVPFETMRFQLVRMLDDLLDALERDDDLPTFLLDGQTAALDDYLEIRPERRGRVERLVQEGRISAGPFLVQPDERLVSGESLVRNLLLGTASAARYGRVLRHGYLPDTFGHVAQLPQVLRGFGIATFLAMRGFGEMRDVGSDFEWEAPDGSTVHGTWLSESYSNAAVLGPSAATTALHHGRLVHYDSLTELLDRLGARSRTGVLLLLNGGDHLALQPGLPGLVRLLDRDVPATLRLGGLDDHARLAAARRTARPVVRGELGRGRTHDVFEGIASTRTALKAVDEQTESLLCGVAERLDAAATAVAGGPLVAQLRHAWRTLVLNHAHDSICGCSVDTVCEDMLARYRHARQVAEAAVADSLARLASATAPPPPGEIDVVVVNPSAHPRSGPVAVEVIPHGEPPLGQRRFDWQFAPELDLSGYQLVDPRGGRVPCTVTPGARIALVDPLHRRKEVRLDTVRFVARDVAPLSTATYRLAPRTGADRPVAPSAPLRFGFADDGTLTLHDPRTGATFTGLLELVDDADAGDEYGHGPLGDPELSSRTAAWEIGDDRSSATASWPLPAGLDADRRARSSETGTVRLTLEARPSADGDRVDVLVTLDNQVRDHRLRLRLPTGLAGARVQYESAFALLDAGRPPADDGTWHEPPTATHVMRRFLVARDAQAGLQVLTEGLHEFTADAGTVDVTLHRGVGWLARTDHPRRSHRVGPTLPTPGAQQLGALRFRVGLRPCWPDEAPGPLFRAAEEFAVPLQAVARYAGAPQPHAGPAGLGVEPASLGVEPAAAVVTAVKVAEDGDGTVVRLLAASDEPVRAVITTAGRPCLLVRCALDEEPAGSPEAGPGETHTLALRPWEIATVRLREPGR